MHPFLTRVAIFLLAAAERVAWFHEDTVSMIFFSFSPVREKRRYINGAIFWAHLPFSFCQFRCYPCMFVIPSVSLVLFANQNIQYRTKSFFLLVQAPFPNTRVALFINQTVADSCTASMSHCERNQSLCLPLSSWSAPTSSLVGLASDVKKHREINNPHAYQLSLVEAK
jgi:hypothetical protein